MRYRATSGDAGRAVYALVAMARPAFLIGTIPLYTVGVAAAADAGNELRISAAVLGLLTVWSVQAMTHYNNEYWDVEADRAVDVPTRISSGSRVLVDRLVPRQLARVAALVAMLFALVLTVVASFIIEVGPVYVGIVAVATVFGWMYSSPPVRLVARGVGEAVVALVTGCLLPAAGYLLQAPTLDFALVRVTPPLVLLAFATSVATAIPDVAADRRTNKRTLPVRLGVPRSVALVGVVLSLGWLLFGHHATAIAPALGFIASLAGIGLLSLFVLFAPAVMRESKARADRLAMVVLTALGWASLSTTALLFLS